MLHAEIRFKNKLFLFHLLMVYVTIKQGDSDCEVSICFGTKFKL